MKTKRFLLLTIINLAFFCTDAQSQFQVVVKGKGEPVLLFPGFGCTGEVWNETVASLSKNYECHIFTFAGFGKVPAIEGPWLSNIKDALLKYVKEKNLKRPTIVGHSLGGTLGLWLAILEKDTFKKIIVVDALPSTAALMIPNYNGDIIPYDNPQSKMMLEMDSASFATMSGQSVPYLCLNKDKHNTIRAWIGQTDRKTYVKGYIDLLNLDLRKQIRDIKTPVTVLAATSPDRATVEKVYKTQYAGLPSVDIQYAENSAHFLMYDQTEWFINKVKEVIR
jgi:pimeloyl-ACP methyl ester carboxylesterase